MGASPCSILARSSSSLTICTRWPVSTSILLIESRTRGGSSVRSDFEHQRFGQQAHRAQRRTQLVRQVAHELGSDAAQPGSAPTHRSARSKRHRRQPARRAATASWAVRPESTYSPDEWPSRRASATSSSTPWSRNASSIALADQAARSPTQQIGGRPIGRVDRAVRAHANEADTQLVGRLELLAQLVDGRARGRWRRAQRRSRARTACERAWMIDRRPSQMPAIEAAGGRRRGRGQEPELDRHAPSLGGAAQHVTHAADRFEQLGVLRILLDLRAQPVDVNVDRARLAGVVVAPDVGQQLLAREDLALVAQEESEQVECLGLDRSYWPSRSSRWPARSIVARPTWICSAPSVVGRWRGSLERRSRPRMRACSSRRLNGLVT